ncbi:TPA: aminotransferase class I/II-fold pyridoxal phosphate-dependent enzyme [Candidatus Poribacteria bacterium]|nr:aminotransferase class I/II-fold pyridoxal phosphate-dependent enzyme [Candidatus Poribacteria bacterium]
MKGKPILPPVYFSATYQFDCTDDLVDVVQNRTGFIYSRWDNPTVFEVEKILANLEGYDNAIGFGSGMSAITTTILTLINKNSRIITVRETYGGTFAFINKLLPKLGIQTIDVNCDDIDTLKAEIKKGATILYLETPTNPLLKVIDVKPLADLAHKNDIIVILDSTFASPINQRPMELGVDITIHSATKYLGGHHDITAGFVCCQKEYFELIWDCRRVMGGILDPMTAYLVARGLKTLEIRVLRQNENAIKIAKFLSKHKKVEIVHYPGLPSSPYYEIAKRQMKGFGGMLSFEIKSDFEGTKRFVDNLKFIKIATSLGGVSTLATQPVTNTHVGLSEEERKKSGISDSLVRISVGVENPDLIIDDIKQALDKV